MKSKETDHYHDDVGKNIDFQKTLHCEKPLRVLLWDHNIRSLLNHLHNLKMRTWRTRLRVLFVLPKVEEQNIYSQKYEDENTWDAFGTNENKVFHFEF